MAIPLQPTSGRNRLDCFLLSAYAPCTWATHLSTKSMPETTTAHSDKTIFWNRSFLDMSPQNMCILFSDNQLTKLVERKKTHYAMQMHNQKYSGHLVVLVVMPYTVSRSPPLNYCIKCTNINLLDLNSCWRRK